MAAGRRRPAPRRRQRCRSARFAGKSGRSRAAMLVPAAQCVRVRLTKSRQGKRETMAGWHRGIVTCLMLGVAGPRPCRAGLRAVRHSPLGRARDRRRHRGHRPGALHASPGASPAATAGCERQLETASSLWSDRETPASGNAGLLAKARGDYRRLLAALYTEGYYGPAISIRAAGEEVADAGLDAELRRAGADGDRRAGRAALPLRPRRDGQRAAGRRLRARRHRDAGGGRVPPGRDRALGDHQPGLGALDRAVAAPVAGQGARGRPRGDRRPCHRPARRRR